jgi:hypothetical protein
LWYLDAAAAAVGYAKFYSRSHPTIIRVYDHAGAVIGTHEHAGDFKEVVKGSGGHPALKIAALNLTFSSAIVRLRPWLTKKKFTRSHHAVIRVYDEAGNVIEAHEHEGQFKEL